MHDTNLDNFSNKILYIPKSSYNCTNSSIQSQRGSYIFCFFVDIHFNRQLEFYPSGLFKSVIKMANEIVSQLILFCWACIHVIFLCYMGYLLSKLTDGKVHYVQ